MTRKRNPSWTLIAALAATSACGEDFAPEGEVTTTSRMVSELRGAVSPSSLTNSVGAGTYCGDDLARRCALASMTACMIEAEFGFIQFIPALSGKYNRNISPSTLIPSLEDTTGETIGEWVTGITQYWLDPSHSTDDLFEEMSNYCGAVTSMIDGAMGYTSCVAYGCARGSCGETRMLDSDPSNTASCEEFEDLQDAYCADFFDPTQCAETERLVEPAWDDYIPPSNTGGSGGTGGSGPGGGGSSGGDGSGGYDDGGGSSGGGTGGGSFECYAVYQTWEMCTYVGGALMGCSTDQIFMGIECEIYQQ